MTSTINIDLEKLTAMLLLAGKEDVRQYLNAVCIEATATETRMLASNGHMGGMLRNAGFKDNPNVYFHTVSVPRAIIEAIGWKAKNGSNFAQLIVTQEVNEAGQPGASYMIRTVSGATFTFEKEEVNYPDLRRVMPWDERDDQGKAAQLNHLYVAAMVKFAKAIGGEAPTFRHDGAVSVVQVLTKGCTDFIGCIMPMRQSEVATPARWPAIGPDVEALPEGV